MIVPSVLVEPELATLADPPGSWLRHEHSRRATEPFSAQWEAALPSVPPGQSHRFCGSQHPDPEMMALLSNPRLQDVMKEVMNKGQAGVDPSIMKDPETRELLQKLQGILGSQGK